MNIDPLLKQWQTLLNQVNRLSRRERVQLLVTMAVVMGGAWSQLVMDPFKKQQLDIQKQRVSAETTIQEMATMEMEILARKDNNPDQAEQDRINLLKKEIDQLDKKLDTGYLGMVSPTELIQALKAMLVRDYGLTLMELKTFPPVNLLPDNDSGSTVFQHTLIFRFSGEFPDLLKYLRNMERLPWKLFWDSVQFVVDDYPKALVKLKINTLSISDVLLGSDS